MPSGIEKAATFCNRAAELRAIADGVIDQDNRDALLKLAESYETMAQRIIGAMPNVDPDPPSK